MTNANCLTLEKLSKARKILEEAHKEGKYVAVPYYMSRKNYDAWEEYKPGFIEEAIKKKGYSHIEISETISDKIKQ